jgi:hypothetical protein
MGRGPRVTPHRTVPTAGAPDHLPTAQQWQLGRGARAGARLRLPGVGDVWKKRHLTGSLDRDRHLALVFPARARIAAALDLPPLGDEPAKLRDVLVINFRNLPPAEEARPSPITPTGASPRARRPCLIADIATLRSSRHNHRLTDLKVSPLLER